MGALHKGLKLSHSGGNILCQLCRHIIIICYGIGRAGLSLNHRGVRRGNAISAPICLGGVRNNAGVPDVGDREILFERAEQLRCNVIKLTGAINAIRASGKSLPLIPESPYKELIYYMLHLLIRFICQYTSSANVFHLPVEHLNKVVLLRIGNILLCSLIVCRGDIVHKITDNILSLVCVNIYTARRNLAILILNI